MPSVIKRRLNIGFVFGILLVLMVGTISFISLQKQYHEGELVRHTYGVINHLQEIQNILIDMETGRRGFRTTNEKKFLEPYRTGLVNIGPSIAELQRQISDNPQQFARAEQLKISVQNLLSFWMDLGEDASGYTRERISEIMSGEKIRMDQIRLQLHEMVSAENDLLTRREISNRSSKTFTQQGLIIGIVLILCIVILLIIQILQEFKNRRKAEEDLQTNFRELSLVNEQNARRNWLLNGLAKVNDTLQGHTNEAGLSGPVLQTIVKYAGVEAGGFYIYNDEKENLLLTASHALPATIKKEYTLHEGLVGQAAVETEPVIISEIPPKYVSLTGGTVAIEPVHAIYASLHQNNELKGVIELLSFKPVKDETIELLKLISNNIADCAYSLASKLGGGFDIVHSHNAVE